MIKIKLNSNKEKERYDVYHIFKLFYGFKEIKFEFGNAEEYDYEVNIFCDRVVIKAKDGEEKSFYINNENPIRHEIRSNIFKYLREETGKELPWGVLIGIRPTKIVLDMIRQGIHEEEIIKKLKDYYFLNDDKAKLCMDIAKKENQKVNKNSKTVSVYIGMPFCPTRCLYCSFASNTIKGCEKLVQPYLDALNYEIEKIKEFIDKKELNVECVYFGGGTPTSVNDNDFENVLRNIYDSFVKNRDVKEFNVECGRPDSININKLKSMKKYNVDRISINPQSMNEDTLKFIGRNHSVQDIIDKFNLARELGFDNINMDIIIGIPNETLEHVETTCREILKLHPDSLTVHGMSIKRGSILHDRMLKKEIKLSEQNELNEMFQDTSKLAKDLGMKPYYMYRQKNIAGNMENVGYCVEGKDGLYNIEMIEDKQTIIALGAHSVTKVVFLDNNRIERFGNIKDVREYVNRIEEKVNGKIELLETLY